jgi:hypothetical protein
MRAIMLAGALVVTMLLSCLAAAIWENGASHTRILYLTVLACAAYLVQKDALFHKVAAGIAAAAAALVFAIGVSVLTVVQLRGTFNMADVFVGNFFRSFVGMLIVAAAVVAAGFLATLVVKGDTRRQTTKAALFCGGAYLVFNMITAVIVFRSSLSSAIIYSGIGVIPNAVALGLAIKLASLLCLAKGQRLQTGAGPKVWFVVCMIFSTLSVVVLFLLWQANPAIVDPPGFFAVLLSIAGIVGYVFLLCSRRTGYVLILIASGTLLFGNLSFNLGGILVGFEVGAGPQVLGEYTAGLFSSLLIALNPTITGLVLLRAWKAVPLSAGPAPVFMGAPAPGTLAPGTPGALGAAAPTSSVLTQPSTSAPAPTSKPKPQPKPAQTAKGPRFKLYTGSGVCDVCNKPLSSCKAYVVPNDVFYRSPKYRNWVKNNSLSALMGIPINDAYFAQMQARDHSQGSAVCEDCVSMFE